MSRKRECPWAAAAPQRASDVLVLARSIQVWLIPNKCYDAYAGPEATPSVLPTQSFHIAPPVTFSATFRPPLLSPSMPRSGGEHADASPAQEGQPSEPHSPSRKGRLRLSLPRLSSQKAAQPLMPMQLDVAGTNLDVVTSLAVGSQRQAHAAHTVARTWQNAAGQQHMEQV